MINNLFRNPKSTQYAIVVFVVVLLALFSCHARAADQTLTFEAGSAVLRGEAPTVGLTISCPSCGPVNTDFEYGFDLVGSSVEKRDNPNAIGPRIALVDGWKKFELGIGMQWWNVEWEYTCQFNFHLLARYRATERLGVQWRHSSSAGTCSPNYGRDLLTVGWRF